MTRPTSRITWTPDPAEAHAVRLAWVGAGWHYTIYWGDGTSDSRLFWQPPVKHTYPRAGVYDVVCVSAINRNVTMAAQIVVRGWVRPPQPEAHLDGATVTLTMPPVAEPVRWRVSWGDEDGTVTEHGPGDQPATTYPWGFGAPEITVTDVPSRRAVTFTGPEVGPEPAPRPVPEWTFHHDYLPPRDHVNPESMTGGFHGRNLRPGLLYRVRLNWSDEPDRYATVTADSQGQATAVIPGELSWTVQSGKWYGPWRTCVAYEDADPAGTFAYVPVTTRADGVNPDGPTVTYALHPTDPFRFQVQVQKPEHGSYTIDWGDGTSGNVAVGDDGVFAAWHTYRRTVAAAIVQVTDPTGRTGTVKIGRASIVDPYFYRVDDILGSAARTRLEYPTGDAATPMIVRWRNGEGGGERYGDGIPGQPRILGPQGAFSPTAWYRREWWGREVTITVHGPLRDPVNVTTVVPDALPSALRRRDFDPPVWPDGSPNQFHEPELTAWFGDVTEWVGGYSGKFHVTNHTAEPQPWVVEFVLADPAVLREVWEVWPHTARFVELPGGRWRIWSGVPLGGGQATSVGARIEPPGKTRKYPDDIAAHPRRQNKEAM